MNKSETEPIRDEIDYFVRANSAGRTNSVAHAPDPDSDSIEPLCEQIRYDHAGSGGGGEHVRWVKKDLSAYPPGYLDICRNCRIKLGLAEDYH